MPESTECGSPGPVVFPDGRLDPRCMTLLVWVGVMELALLVGVGKLESKEVVTEEENGLEEVRSPTSELSNWS